MVKVQVEVFSVVMLCSAVIGYQHFGGPCCLHLQSEVTGNRKDGHRYRPREQECGRLCKPAGNGKGVV